MKLAEIAAGINAHLKRFEADPKLNPPAGKYGNSLYYHARAYVGGRWVYVAYVSYHGSSNLSKADAERYLDWLNAGNIGRHWEALR